MKKFLWILLTMCSMAAYSQVGIGTGQPTAQLDVDGNFTTREKKVTINAADVSVTIPVKESSQIQIAGQPNANFEIIAESGASSGQKLIIFNNTENNRHGFLLDSNGNKSEHIVYNGELVEFVFSEGEWRSLSASGSGSKIRGSLLTKAIVPEFSAKMNDITNNPDKYETQDWKIVDYTEFFGVSSVDPSHTGAGTPYSNFVHIEHTNVVITFEYKQRMLDLDNVHSFVSTKMEKSSYQDKYHKNYQASIIDIYNENEKTLVKVTVANLSGMYGWGGAFSLYQWEEPLDLSILLITTD